MAEHVKIYEEKRSGLPLWAWLIPLFLLLALLAYFLLHRPAATANTAGAPFITSAAAAPGVFPDPGTVHFDTDQATLTPESTKTLQIAVIAMKANPNVHLRLEGYTDSTGTSPHNDTLSEQRAKTVADFFAAQGIDRSRLTGEGFGAAKPVDTNATNQGKADNRRVELFSQQ